MALFLPAATAGVHGSSGFRKHSLPSGLDRGSHNSALNTTDRDDHLRNSQPQVHAAAMPPAWARAGAAGDLPWGPAVAGDSPGRLAIGEASLRCAKSVEQADGIRLSEVLALSPALATWAFPEMEGATEEPTAPFLPL